MDVDTEERKKELASHAANLMRRSMAHLIVESDRAFVILAAIQIEELLEGILLKCLAEPAGKKDELFDEGRGILRDFNAKIELVRRLGHVSTNFAKALHELRKIRNACAHSGESFVLSDSPVRDRISNLKDYLSHSMELSSGTEERMQKNQRYVREQLDLHEANPHREITEELIDLAACIQELLIPLCMVKEIVPPFDGPRFDEDFYRLLGESSTSSSH